MKVAALRQRRRRHARAKAAAAPRPTNPAGRGRESRSCASRRRAPPPRRSRAGTPAPRSEPAIRSRPCRRRFAARCSNIMSTRPGSGARGKDGRLTKDDVIAAAEAQKAGAPAQAGAQAPKAKAPMRRKPACALLRPRPSPGNRKEERVKMSRLRQTIAKRLKDAQNTAALLTTFNDVDMTRGDRRPRPLQGSVRKEARHPPRLHGLLREGGGARRARTCRRSTPASRATRSSITIISTSRSRSRRPRGWSCRSSATPTR